jgi:arylsulfatase A-like enzyme
MTPMYSTRSFYSFRAHAWLPLFLFSMIHAFAQPGAKPNVLLIVSDDQGFSDFGFTGNPLVKTPVLDRLAAESAVFKNFVVAAACSPTRSALYTGREHLSTGVWGVPPRANLRPDEALMPAFFRADGYRTFYAGKSDTARLPESSPWDRGWDQGYFVSGYQHRDPTLPNRGTTLEAKGWTVDLVTDLILDFVREPRPEPWFATAAYITPHLPWVCDEKFSAPFLAQGLSPDLARCYGSIAQMDAAIGRLLAGVRAIGQADNTVVVFLSDNGMSHKAEVDRELATTDWAKRNVHGLRGHKTTVWENGIRVPLLVRWPGQIAPGERKQFGAVEDILPTILDLAGLRPDAVKHLPFVGVSLRPALRDAAVVRERAPAFRIAISGAGSPKPQDESNPRPRRFEEHHLVLRGERFKFHALPGGKSALFDLAADPVEASDVAARFPEIAASMSVSLREQWAALLATGRAFATTGPVESPRARKR